ncbi:MAG: deoxyguanosinetriphosphate triphosphohydrolase [Dehalococcoidia bacterium]|nr:deoxyguanosinetriphosphate triphosphohydrolase [Chloroflexota bacterium]MCK4222225.1 deoxyguanosinetriphosphate triphosphohydrolase [Dehalococcoidia bacterium]MCK4262688.1 deoxyguanosinetriphosphate triphosphohydrolase [Dehalococcoidia bacterium]
MVSELDIRGGIERKEETLSPFAVKSRLSRGRAKREEPCPVRTCFQRDRDRIIYSKAFRRLKHKTQVFIAPLGDHYVTRLTHTLEVSQIARTISRALNLNEDLTEAIALGHDLGHTPFGHIGEEVLNELHPGGFRHSEQSLRVVDLLENEGEGLNLTWEVRDGILKHSKGQADILGDEWEDVGTSEGQVCQVADVIAYINHDIGDAIRAGIITESDLPERAVQVLGRTHSRRISTLVYDIVECSWARPTIGMSPKVVKAANTLRQFLFDRVYHPSLSTRDANRARTAIHLLFSYFLAHEAELPPEFASSTDTSERKVADYVAGMTDQYALRLAEGVST